MSSQIRDKGKEKTSSSRGPLDLSRLFPTSKQQKRYEAFFHQKKLMKPKHGSFVSFPDVVFSFPAIYEGLGLDNLIREPVDFYPKLVKVLYPNMILKRGKLTYMVKGVPISMNAYALAIILGIPSGGCEIRVNSKSSWDNYDKQTFCYSLSRLSGEQFYNKRKKNSRGLPECVYWSPTKFTLYDRMLHYFLVYHMLTS
ncbi:hypothetical protein KIW84_033021 [Lathyrus oleraceus]|uniref:Uncharacterized protein n=1 Tax=Pisum sativum TaxID=3888 RepID=A0A9D4XWX4_PEA|nr:hypothetical protein KIW84_033021 [Pisum sativum]